MKRLPAKRDNRAEASALKEQFCPGCGTPGLSLFYEVSDVPVQNCSIAPTREEALKVRRGDIALGFCERCGLISNIAFDSMLQDYSLGYEDQQCFSPTFNAFAYGLASHLIKRYDLYEKEIVEIGCGKGDFLRLICELGRNCGVGIDPACAQEQAHNEAAERVTFIQDYYSERYAHYRSDLICCRHTLEHIHPVAEFMSTVRRSIGDRLNTIVFFEVPDVTQILRDVAFWDIYYEHCSYFSAGSLARLFRSCGFEIIDLARAYDDQYLLIEARPVNGLSHKIHVLEERLEQMACEVENFSRRIGSSLKQWKQRLQQIHTQRKRVVVWGSGSKCVAFLTNLDTEDNIEYVVDINPRRHEKYIPGVGKRIVPPEFLKQYRPDVVVVMNSIYYDEIRQLLDTMGVSTAIVRFEVSNGDDVTSS
jgi:SAM-dependent methyltransferase